VGLDVKLLIFHLGTRFSGGGKRIAYRILVRKQEGKGQQGRPRSKWLDNIKMVLKDIEWDGMD
jgi:hypothetical protein